MLSLAPLKYRNILKENGGPLEKLTWSKAQISFDTEGFEASCFLKSALTKGSEAYATTYSLYANADGTGSDIYKSIACYKAISEAMERWAYYETSSSDKSAEYAFNIDPSTTGMAAFPGITNSHVIALARNEAIERWALIEWWSGNLAASKITRNGIDSLIITVVGYGVVCVSWIKKSEGWSYGFACATNFETAFKKAQVELFRNIHVISNFRGKVEKLNLQEQRVIFFSTKEGHECFLNVVEKSLLVKQNATPRLITNKEIPGPWSRYCTVWRCLFEITNPDSEKLEFFLF